jgi:hypothetical protein
MNNDSNRNAVKVNSLMVNGRGFQSLNEALVLLFSFYGSLNADIALLLTKATMFSSMAKHSDNSMFDVVVWAGKIYKECLEAVSHESYLQPASVLFGKDFFGVETPTSKTQIRVTMNDSAGYWGIDVTFPRGSLTRAETHIDSLDKLYDFQVYYCGIEVPVIYNKE